SLLNFRADQVVDPRGRVGAAAAERLLPAPRRAECGALAPRVPTRAGGHTRGECPTFTSVIAGRALTRNNVSTGHPAGGRPAGRIPEGAMADTLDVEVMRETFRRVAAYREVCNAVRRSAGHTLF